MRSSAAPFQTKDTEVCASTVQLQENPIAMDQRTLFGLLTQGLPLLRHIDGLDVPISRKLSNASIPQAPVHALASPD